MNLVAVIPSVNGPPRGKIHERRHYTEAPILEQGCRKDYPAEETEGVQR